MTAVSERVSIWGSSGDRREAMLGGIVAGIVTLAYMFVAGGFDSSPTTVEVFALWASLACVWLARTENIWTMPYGIVSVVLLGWFLLDIGLVGQGWLQFVYYVPIQLAGWWAWARGGPGQTELRVSRLTPVGWLVLIIGGSAAWLGVVVLFSALYEDPAYLWWDASIVAASIAAQSLMTLKKRESWWFWSVPVNVSSIGLFVVTKSWAFVFLYVVFLGNSIWGWRQWNEAEANHG